MINIPSAATDRPTMGRVNQTGLSIAKVLYDFVQFEVLQGTDISSQTFWQGFADMHAELKDENRALLLRRDELQTSIDAWHLENPTAAADPKQTETFLRSIGYIVDEGDGFTVTTEQLDDEVSINAGPQLVVPITNARYAINAVNARWGSLYDALYGTDAIEKKVAPIDSSGAAVYGQERGNTVIAWVRKFLDDVFPLVTGSHSDAISYTCKQDALDVTFADGSVTTLQTARHFLGYMGAADDPAAILLLNHGLRIKLVIDRNNSVGKCDQAGIADVYAESALSVILDLEDSVAAVDATDKVAGYRNWLGLVKGTLTAQVDRGSDSFVRRLNATESYTKTDGSVGTLSSRALMLVRNVGHLMMTDAVKDSEGHDVYEGQLDALITAAVGLHDVNGNQDSAEKNSSAGSIYIVKPKMHGPEEAAFADKICTRVESILGMAPNVIKLGLMDEERRTTLNLKECIRALKQRIFFINTGFLDRTGDEIHTNMKAGPVIKKYDMRDSKWIHAYEQWNIDIGLDCGMSRRGQLGKGMWAMPDRMNAMMKEKGGQLLAGATTAWVPSPTAATLHALHYHKIDVFQTHKALKSRERASLDDLLTLSTGNRKDWSAEEIQRELDNNVQGILGYVVRWVEQGVGCSKVPDINDVALMEDRATLRISSQHIANWLQHSVVTSDQVYKTLKRMADVVDKQNVDTSGYRNMSGRFQKSKAFAAACDLIYKGAEQPSGYTEPLLHTYRRFAKRQKF